MTISSSGIYCLSFEKALIDTLGESWEAEDNKYVLIGDSHTPDYTAHDFENDLTDVKSGGSWPVGGVALTGTEVTNSAGITTFDASDVVQATSTLTDVMAGVLTTEVGTTATDQLLLLQDYVTAVTCSGGTFTVQHHASGIATFDLVP
jgi:hypothetical protein